MTLGLRSIFLFFVFIFIPCVPVQAQERLTSDNREVAQKMGAMYGQFLFNSYCVKAFPMYMTNNNVSASDPQAAKRLADGCSCMTKVMSENVSSNSLIKYVMTMEGVSSMGAKNPAEIEEYYRRNNLEKVGNVANDERIRKKCGFLR